MLTFHSFKIQVDKKEVFIKGTVAFLTTFFAGLLFGKANMMIAFVIVLGSNVLAQQNFRIRLFDKLMQLILIDIGIVVVSYIASLHVWWGVGINLVMIFLIIFLAMTPFEPLRYKTFMMLYVFCQYSAISLEQLPQRLLMVIFSVSIVILLQFIGQRKDHALLSDEISKAFSLLREQLSIKADVKTYEVNYEAINEQMRSLAYHIYRTGHRRYFTTYLGKVQFHFYLNISYLNLLIFERSKEEEKGESWSSKKQELAKLIGVIDDYFSRQISRKQVILALDKYLAETKDKEDYAKIKEVLSDLKMNFEALEDLDHQKKHKLYHTWKRSELSKVHKQAKRHFNSHNMSFNFALRMAVILTVCLFLAKWLGFYKFIWVIIPIMSITQPYYEDTHRRKKDRIISNILAAIGITVILDIANFWWVSYIMLIAAFYLIFAYKDYYHFSFFITIISMIISSIEMGIDTLLIYRIIYVLLGAVIVTITTNIFPYYLKDGIADMTFQLEEINEAIEKEAFNLARGEGNLDLVREALIRSAVITSKLIMQNKVYQSEALMKRLNLNTEFCIRIGYRLLRGEV